PCDVPSTCVTTSFTTSGYVSRLYVSALFFFTHTPTPDTYTLSLHDALPIYQRSRRRLDPRDRARDERRGDERISGRRRGEHPHRSEEHTSELQSPYDLVCRLLLEKKKDNAADGRRWRQYRGPIHRS